MNNLRTIDFVVEPDIYAAFPNHATLLWGAVTVPQSLHTLESVSDKLRTLCEAELGSRSPAEFESVQVWRNAMKQMGCSARITSSIEALATRFFEKKALYQINPLVDLYNWISLYTGCPMAGYDCDTLAGTLRLRYGRKGESFVPLGTPKQVEKVKNGEIVYADDLRVICRYWNYRDCHDTRITEQTKHVVFFADLVGSAMLDIENQAARICQLLEDAFGMKANFQLSKKSP